MYCKCKKPEYHKKKDDKSDSLWCRTCKKKTEYKRNDEDAAWDYYYAQMDAENEERYENCTCGSYALDGMQVGDCICGNT